MSQVAIGKLPVLYIFGTEFDTADGYIFYNPFRNRMKIMEIVLGELKFLIVLH